jgi:hypothetical protein
MPISKKRLREIEAVRDDAIDYSEIPELPERFWEEAELQMPQPKKPVSIWMPTFWSGSSLKVAVTRPVLTRFCASS